MTSPRAHFLKGLVSMRSPWLFVLAALASCAPPLPPGDLSNATLPTTRGYQDANMNAVTQVNPAPRVLGLLAAPDRAPEDRALDDSRQAADMLTFLAVEPGARVAELACGKGYLTELIARAVGPRGVVYGQNAPGMLAGSPVEQIWAARLQRPSDSNVLRVNRDFVDPLPSGTRDLNLVFLAIDYGELVPLGVNRDAMNHAAHLALRRGGRYVVLVRTPPEGAALTDLHKLPHRSRAARGARSNRRDSRSRRRGVSSRLERSSRLGRKPGSSTRREARSLRARVRETLTHVNVPERELRYHAKIDPHRRGSSLADVILGGQDGLVNVLGVILGVAAATANGRIVLAAGFASTLAGAVSMAAVAYSSRLAESARYESERAREYRHVRAVPTLERAEIRAMYARKGFDGPLLDRIVETITANEDVWVAVMMSEEHKLAPIGRLAALRGALVVGAACFVR